MNLPVFRHSQTNINQFRFLSDSNNLEYLLERFFDAHKFFEHKIQTFYEDEHPNEKGN